MNVEDLRVNQKAYWCLYYRGNLMYSSSNTPQLLIKVGTIVSITPSEVKIEFAENTGWGRVIPVSVSNGVVEDIFISLIDARAFLQEKYLKAMNEFKEEINSLTDSLTKAMTEEV